MDPAGVALPLPTFDGPPPRVLIVAAPFYRDIADALATGARRTLDAAGCATMLIEVPGALEIATAMRLAERRFDAFVALGCVIRGETTHYETVCEESARGLTLLGVDRGLCIGNGVLTCETMAQAVARADPDGMDKGGGAAAAALHLAALARRFAEPAAMGFAEPPTRYAGQPRAGA
jgi:6,7-dimethyl-8-ribityllumazine synthase